MQKIGCRDLCCWYVLNMGFLLLGCPMQSLDSLQPGKPTDPNHTLTYIVNPTRPTICDAAVNITWRVPGDGSFTFLLHQNVNCLLSSFYDHCHPSVASKDDTGGSTFPSTAFSFITLRAPPLFERKFESSSLPPPL